MKQWDGMGLQAGEVMVPVVFARVFATGGVIPLDAKPVTWLPGDGTVVPHGADVTADFNTRSHVR